MLETSTRNNKKPEIIVENQKIRTTNTLSTPQDNTPHDNTPQRNPLLSSPALFSRLSSLVPFCPLFHAKKYLNYFTINAANKSLWSLWKDSETFLRDPRCALSEFLVKKNTGWSSFWHPWCHVFLEPQRGSPSSSQYSFLHLSHDTIFVFLPPWKIHPDVLIQHCVVERYRLVVETTQSVFRPLVNVDEKLDTKLI